MVFKQTKDFLQSRGEILCTVGILGNSVPSKLEVDPAEFDEIYSLISEFKIAT